MFIGCHTNLFNLICMWVCVCVCGLSFHIQIDHNMNIWMCNEFAMRLWMSSVQKMHPGIAQTLTRAVHLGPDESEITRICCALNNKSWIRAWHFEFVCIRKLAWTAAEKCEQWKSLFWENFHQFPDRTESNWIITCAKYPQQFNFHGS